ncbi:MAG: NAD(P)/FAD-dependent oxidoreductase [Acidimicrobiia bacterium]
MTDFVVIGGGIAGVSAAAHLAPHGSVILLEMESTLAYHTTGRSAALFVINYGTQGSRPLGLASRAFLENPPEGSTDAPLLTHRGLLWIADETQMAELSRIAREGRDSGAGSRLIPSDEVLGLVPALNSDRIAGGLFEPYARDIDVAALQQAFVRIARSHDAEIRTRSHVTAIERKGSGWIVKAGNDTLECGAIVNASGAWGDRVAALADIEPIGLQPMRRTAFMVPGTQDYAHWPMVVDADQRFYFKPDGVQLLCSLAEEELSDPTDPKPRVEDVALAIELINETTTLGIKSVNSQWTGLRTFSPDRDLVIGEEPTAPGFFWLVGQGGTGIQTSPAYGSLLASHVLGTEIPELLVEAGVEPSTTDPRRFRD